MCVCDRCAFDFFLKHLRVGVSRISAGASFHTFRAECLKPFLRVPYLVLGFEHHGNSLFHILSALISAQSYPKDFQGLTYSRSCTS